MIYRILLTSLLTAIVLSLHACDSTGKAQTDGLQAQQQMDADQQASAWYVESRDPKSQVQLLKSPGDDRNYRYFRLNNGLQVVLISDADADKAAASLSIDIGSFENPENRAGLAHFLEHMLFLGTDRFPEPGEYQAFLSEHGGTFNAYTSLEETNYFFDVDAAHLMPTLDRFSRFFVAPLFNPEYVDRERHAVDSEYQLKIKDDSRRVWDVLRELANPDHPFSGFSVGNLDTLSNPDDNPVRADLLDFYDRYYSASRMTLTVLGSESLDELQAAVRSRFDEVPAKEVDTPHTQTPLFKEALPVVINFKPEKETRSLSFDFPLPSVEPYWRQKPAEFLGHLLGHEGEGSLIQRLKDRGLAETLSAGLVFDSRHGSLFAVNIRLTSEGFERCDQVIRAFFQWLDLVKREGIEAWRYEEMARLSEQAFRFAEKIPPMDYVRTLSTQLHQVSPRELLLSNYLYEQFDEELISSFAAHLNPHNVAIVVTAPEVETNRNTVLYDAPYQIASWSLPEAGDISGGAAKFALPAANPYIAENLAIVPSGAEYDHPERMGQNQWFYPDSLFRSPKGYFDVRVAINNLSGVEDSARLDLLLALVNDRLAAESYPAMLAGLGFTVSPWEKGYAINVTGYNDKQPVLLGKILDDLSTAQWSQAQFDRVRQSMVRSLRNQAKEWPLRQLFTRLGPLLKDTWLPSEKAEVLAGLSLEQLRDFQPRLLQASSVRYYAGGNYTREQAKAMFAQVADRINNLNVPDELKVVKLRPSQPLSETRYYVDHNDAAAILYLQGQQDSLTERAAFTVMQKMLSAPFYSSLRTEKQLGYAVGSSISHVHRVPGMVLYVQSPKMAPAGLRAEMSQFLIDFEKQVEQLTDEELARYQAAVLATIEERPRNIGELAQRHLESLDLDYGEFDFRARLADAVRNLDVAALRRAYRDAMLGERAGLWIVTDPDPSIGVGQPIPEVYVEGVFRLPVAMNQ
jgi:insulysin